MEWVDDLQRSIRLKDYPCRIVSLVPSITETLFALGAGHCMVGVTRFCTHPPEAVARLQKIGGTKNPHIEKIVSLAPDLVIANAEENRREDVEKLEHASIAVYVTFPRAVQDGIAMIRSLGKLVGQEHRATEMSADLERIYHSIREVTEKQKRVRVFCPIWKRPWMTFNRDTYIDQVLWTCGGDNVLREETQRYFAVSLEEVAALCPEVILLPDEPYPFAAKDLAGLTPLSDTPALRAGRVFLIDGKALSWYGPRMGAGLQTVSNIIHADI